MKNKYVLAVCLVLPFVAISSALFYLLGKTDSLLPEETYVRVRMKGYDPRDIVAGHYLFLTPDWAETDCNLFPDKTCAKARTVFKESYRYYIPQKQSAVLERAVQSGQAKVSVTFLYRSNKAPIMIGSSLMLDEIPWQEWLRQQEQARLDPPQTKDED